MRTGPSGIGTLAAMTESATLRRGTPADTPAIFEVFLASVRDLARRLATPWESTDAEIRERLEPLMEHIGAHAAEWWLAESPDGAIVGYARSVERGGLLELTEFFVHPDRQSAGVGTALLERAFPADRGEVRAIIATTDLRAQARYYRAGTVARFPIVSMEGPPAPTTDDPSIEAVRAGAADIEMLRDLERRVLEFERGDEFGWLLGRREGWIYRRDGRPIGFAFVGTEGSGPIASLEAEDQAPILRHVETRAAEIGVPLLSLEVPMINGVAMRHLLDRGFRIDPFLTLLMSNRPFGQFDRYVGFSPPFIL
jgi:GNAT superfamily N-acetyltransferase